MSILDLAQQLAHARLDARVLDASPWLGAIASVDDAYKTQSQLASLAGDDVRGWKVTALTTEQQRGYNTNRPVAGVLLAPFVHNAPATVKLPSFVSPLLECEIAFLLGHDLAAREQPYGREEIEAAVEAIVPAMEIADCRWPADAPALLKLADDMGNGDFITGHHEQTWRSVDLAAIDVVLTHAGAEVARGNCARILGDPLMAVVALANAQPLPAGGLKRGHIVTTGTCTTPLPLRRGQYFADFGPLGILHLTIA
jgi:2-keto-4-pentenoate hydratase